MKALQHKFGNTWSVWILGQFGVAPKIKAHLEIVLNSTWFDLIINFKSLEIFKITHKIKNILSWLESVARQSVVFKCCTKGLISPHAVIFVSFENQMKCKVSPFPPNLKEIKVCCNISSGKVACWNREVGLYAPLC